MEVKAGRSRQDEKSIEERVSYALAHRMRVSILTFLNEGVHTADDIAKEIGEQRQNVHHHLRELLSAGSIEVARTERRRNAHLYYYRAVEPPELGEAASAAMSAEERQEAAGIAIQNAVAEIIAALAAGKLSDDPHVHLDWRLLDLDGRGRRELDEEQGRFWDRVREIEAESTHRRATSKEAATSHVVAGWGFERARPRPAASSGPAESGA